MHLLHLLGLVITHSLIASASDAAREEIKELKKTCQPLVTLIRLNLSEQSRDLIVTDNVDKAREDGDRSCVWEGQESAPLRERLTYAGMKYGPSRTHPAYRTYLGELAGLIWGDGVEFTPALLRVAMARDDNELRDMIRREFRHYSETTHISAPDWYRTGSIRPHYTRTQ